MSYMFANIHPAIRFLFIFSSFSTRHSIQIRQWRFLWLLMLSLNRHTITPYCTRERSIRSFHEQRVDRYGWIYQISARPVRRSPNNIQTFLSGVWFRTNADLTLLIQLLVRSSSLSYSDIWDRGSKGVLNTCRFATPYIRIRGGLSSTSKTVPVAATSGRRI